MAAASTTSLKEYLKRYESGSGAEEKKKKKKKKTAKGNTSGGILIVDEDPVWKRPVNIQEESEDEEEKPQVDEDIEVRRMKRLEQIRLARPYNAIAEDGSGWVSLDAVRDSNTLMPDMSPPRKSRARNDTPSPEPEAKMRGREDGSDLSPPRQRRNRRDTPSPKSAGDDDLSPPRHRRNRRDTPSPKSAGDDDLSPPRHRRNMRDTPSPKSAGDDDLSPPRHRRNRRDTPSPKSGGGGDDLSPPRHRRNRRNAPSSKSAGDLDSSPPRKRRIDVGAPDLSPPRNRRNTDLSPPRQSRKRQHSPSQHDTFVPHRASLTSSRGDDDVHGGELDLSPPRRKRNDSRGRASTDLSPPRLSRRPAGNDRTGASLDPDLSPPRINQKDKLLSASYKEPARTGLISAKDIRKELSKTDNTPRFEEMDPSQTGQGAAGVYRDKIKGVRISKDEYLKSKEKKEEKPKEIKLEWGKGLAQKREAEARLQELELEKEKPFARTRDDPELDKMLKDRLRWGDPMAHLVKKKHHEPILPDLGANEKMKESGFIIPQDIPSHSWIKRGLDAAPNRYGIKPGRHWDGVDRSNGYEQQMFRRTNEKQATEREAYLWSVSDM